MRLIGMKKEGNRVKIEFFGCPLHCPYCTHSGKEKEEHDLMEVLEFIADPMVKEVYLGGAEPTLQKRDLEGLLERLSRMDRKVILKTSGFDPDFLEITKGIIDKYVIEVKCPLDDLECNSELTGLDLDRTSRYLERLRKSLDNLKGENVRIWIRVIPGFINEKKIEEIGRSVEGKAGEAILYQFLSNPENDAPFKGISEAGPLESEMVIYARILVKYFSKVMIHGVGFSNTFESTQSP